MQSVKIGIREFRENLASYLESSRPVAITRHGETVGFYIPARPRRSAADLEALKRAGERLDTFISAASASEEELMEDFKARRQRTRKTQR